MPPILIPMDELPKQEFQLQPRTNMEKADHLASRPFPKKKVSCETIVDNTTFNIVVQCPYPPNTSGPKPKASKQLKRKFHSKLSNALWKSINITKPGIFSFRENSFKSKIDRTVSPIKRSFTKPLWL